MATPLRRIVDVVQRPLVASPMSMFYGHLVNWEVLECGHEVRERVPASICSKKRGPRRRRCEQCREDAYRAAIAAAEAGILG